MAEPNTASTDGHDALERQPATRPFRTGSELKPASSGQQTPPQQNRISVIDRVKQSATEQFTTQKDRGIDVLGSVTQAVRSSSQRLREEKHETIAGYVDQAVDQIESWSRRIKEKDLDELVDRCPAARAAAAGRLHRLGLRARADRRAIPQELAPAERPLEGTNRTGRGTVAVLPGAPRLTAAHPVR